MSSQQLGDDKQIHTNLNINYVLLPCSCFQWTPTLCCWRFMWIQPYQTKGLACTKASDSLPLQLHRPNTVWSLQLYLNTTAEHEWQTELNIVSYKQCSCKYSEITDWLSEDRKCDSFHIKKFDLGRRWSLGGGCLLGVWLWWLIFLFHLMPVVSVDIFIG